MDQILSKNKTVIVRSSESNPHYQELKKVIQSNQSLQEKLKSQNVDLVQDLSDKNNGFSLYLYGQNGALYMNESAFDNSTFDRVFSVVDNMTQKPSQSGGGSGQTDYKQKYFKYKHKYEDLRKVISSFQAYGGGVPEFDE